jgi:hypothetical protein
VKVYVSIFIPHLVLCLHVGSSNFEVNDFVARSGVNSSSVANILLEEPEAGLVSYVVVTVFWVCQFSASFFVVITRIVLSHDSVTLASFSYCLSSLRRLGVGPVSYVEISS